jgi:hypothetical protein
MKRQSDPHPRPEEGKGLPSQLVFAVEQLPPNPGGGGEVRQEVAECFDGEPTVVADLAQGVEGRVPSDGSASGYTAVVLGDMHVRDPVPGPPDRIRRVLFLDVGVEGIEVDATARMSDLIYKPNGLIQRIQVIELEPVDDFLGKDDPHLLGVLSYSVQVVDAASPLAFGWTSSCEDAERDLMRAAQDR